MKHGIQKIIAVKAGLSQPFFCQILSRKRMPSWTSAKRLAEVTNTKPELWLEGTSAEIKKALTESYAD
ncbi:hypothetical protein [Desulfonema magnum]|uniref:DNA-binding domain-containing protein n=1 Tax=Desulfonema magnum TaxID=45655 RepID=A0A975BNM4_9BACT|nr:hypothetical protein [Desulfonema magnum]QTA88823.1 DNA-binding domain-containing protein [Desulfonema magnum]